MAGDRRLIGGEVEACESRGWGLELKKEDWLRG